MRKVITGIIALISAVCHAQQPVFKSYSVNDGLPSSEVYHVFQDSKGYVWVATKLGVARYNGYEFDVFGSSDGLPDNTVFEIFEDAKGRIWFVPFSCRLSYYEDGEIKEYAFNDKLQKELNSPIKISFFADEHGNVHLSVVDQGYFLISAEGEIKQLHPESDSSYLKIQDHGQPALFTSQNKTLPTSTRVVSQSFSGRLQLDIVPTNHNIHAYRLKNGKILVTAGDKNSCLVNSDGRQEVIQLDGDAGYIFQDKEGGIWLGTSKSGALYFPHSLRDTPTVFLDGMSVSSIMQDHEGGYWFSTLNNGVFYLPNTAIRTYSTATGWPGDRVNCLAADSQGAIYAGLQQGFLTIIKESSVQHVNLTSTTTCTPEVLLYHEAEQGLYIGGGACGYFMDRNQNISSAKEIGSKSLFLAADGSVLGGTHNRLLRTKEGKLIEARGADGLRLRVNAVYQDAENRIWAGSLDGLWQYEAVALPPKKLQHPLLQSKITALAGFSDGFLCIGTHGAGLLLMKDDTLLQIATQQGLSSDYVNHIQVAGNEIWLATSRGVNKVEVKQTEPLAFHITHITASEGLATDEVNQLLVLNEKVYAATNKGLCVFARNFSPAAAASLPFYITALQVADRDTLLPSEYQLPYYQNSLSFQFSGISYKRASDIIYRYKMAGLDSAWAYTTARSVRYANMPPGDYRFIAQAMLSGTKAVSEAVVMSITITPPFWKTAWFRGLCLLALAALIYAFFKIRVLTYNRDVVRELLLAVLKKFRKREYLVVKADGGIARIDPAAILWLKSDDNYVEIKTAQKRYLVRSTLKAIADKLPGAEDFLRVHRSWVVRIDKIEALHKNSVAINGEQIPVSESKRAALQKVREGMLVTEE